MVKTDVSYSDYGVTYTGMEGLTLVMVLVMKNKQLEQNLMESTLFAKYAIGGATIGIQKSSKTTKQLLM